MVQVASGGAASGTVLSGGGETVAAGGTIGGAVTFAGTGGALSVGGDVVSGLTISGFVKGDTLDLTDIAVKGASLSFVENKAGTSGTLTITNAKEKATVTLFGQYVAAGFKLGNDGHGGAAVTYTSATAAHADLAVVHH